MQTKPLKQCRVLWSKDSCSLQLEEFARDLWFLKDIENNSLKLETSHFWYLDLRSPRFLV